MARYEHLWERVRYSAPIDFILDNHIVEYDIAKANISVLKDKGIINQAEYDRYYAMDKHSREVAIGLMQLRVNGVSATLKQGITEARKRLFELLNLDETSVLSINNDAVYCIFNGLSAEPDIIDITPNVKFIKKGVYRSYYRFGRNKEFFYNYDPMTKVELLDIKGLGDQSIALHKNFMVKVLKDLFYIAITQGPRIALESLKSFYYKYISMELPIEYYRRLDSESLYDLKLSTPYSSYKANNLMIEDKRLIDPSYNAIILNSLAKYYTR